MIQPNYVQPPQGTTQQPGGANAVSINIYNPQAYGNTNGVQQPQQPQQPPYNYTNSVYQMPQGEVYGNQNQAQVPPQQYFVPSANTQVPVNEQNAQPVIAPAPQVMPNSVIPTQQNEGVQPQNAQDPNAQQTAAAALQGQNGENATQDVANNADGKNEEIQSVDTDALIKELKSEDSEAKSQAINKLAAYAQEKPEVALQVVSEPVMQALVDVIKEDTSSLEGPTDKQIEIAEKISKNEQLTPEEEKLSNELSPRDKANKNRIFALYTLAMIQKLQRDELNQYIETQKTNGEQPIEPIKLENLVGYNDIVNVINNDPRPEVKVAAIQALEHVAQPDDKAKVEEILANALKSEDEPVKAAAEEALAKFQPQQ